MYINELSDSDVLIELSSSPSEILDSSAPYGFAYSKTIEHLGLDRHDVGHNSVIIHGSTEAVLSNLSNLHRHIGLIARYGSEKADFWRRHNRDWIGRMLGDLTQRTLPGLPKDTGFTEVVARITRPFAESANDDNEAFDVLYGRTPWWLADSTSDVAKRSAVINSYIASR